MANKVNLAEEVSRELALRNANLRSEIQGFESRMDGLKEQLKDLTEIFEGNII